MKTFVALPKPPKPDPPKPNHDLILRVRTAAREFRVGFITREELEAKLAEIVTEADRRGITT